ncbi:hypothetical protein V5F40_02940 [Xanthobacter sp. DSM 14520]|uniref:hypothetical protein n=1 Tax=Xanthobacter autotrophicus (strain ATCC BAA-1158 / Py2) TaxID=78245 RepID=UPI0037281691
MSWNERTDKHQGVLVDLGFGWRVALTRDQTRFALQRRVWSETRTRQWKTVRTSVNRRGLAALVATHGLDTSGLKGLTLHPPRIIAAPFRDYETPVVRWKLERPSNRQRTPVAGARSAPQPHAPRSPKAACASPQGREGPLRGDSRAAAAAHNLPSVRFQK